MHYFLLLLFFATQFIYLQSMEERKVILITRSTQDLFDQAMYPLSKERMIEFEHAKLLCQTDAEKAKAKLLTFVEDPADAHVPALRLFTSLALESQDFDQAACWTAAATFHPRPDPLCALTLAGLLASDQPMASLENLQPYDREVYISRLLRYAGTPKRFFLKDQEHTFIDSPAEKVLKDYELKKSIEVVWKQLAIDDSVHLVDNFADACAITRKLGTNNDPYLASLIQEALKSLEKNPSESLSAQLGSLYLTGWGNLIPMDEKKGVEFLLAAGDHGKKDLLECFAVIQNGRELVCDAATRGNMIALEALAPQFSHGQNSAQEIFEAAEFWNLFWRSASLPAQKERAVNETQRLVFKSETLGTEQQSLEFDYYAMMTLAETDPQSAMKLLSHAQKRILSSHASSASRKLLESTGAKAFIDAAAAKEEGWAYFAQAVCKSNSMPQNTVIRLHEYMLHINEMQKLLTAAHHAKRPFSDPEILSQNMLDYERALYLKFLSRNAENDESQEAALELLEESLELFDRAANGGSAVAGIEWANIVLSKKSNKFKGQRTFETVVNRLIQGLADNPNDCRSKLQLIYDLGHAQRWPCGGNMTDDIQNKIKNALGIESGQNNAQSVVGTPSVMEQAKKAWNEKRYSDAGTLFDSEAAKGNLAATAYLGLLYEQGHHGKKQEEEAWALFKKSLLGWDGKEMEGDEAFYKAYQATIKRSATDLEAAHAALHFSIYTAHAAASNNMVLTEDTTFKDLEIFERVAARSTIPADRDLLFSSGMARRLTQLYRIDNDAVKMLRLVSQYAKRITDFGGLDPQSNPEHINDLVAPFNNISSLLATHILAQKYTLFTKWNEESNKKLFENLEAALRVRGPQSGGVPLERVLGLLYVNRSLDAKGTEHDFRRGLTLLQKAAAHNDREAALVLGNYNLNGLKKFPGVLREVKRGIAMLEGLAAQNNFPASFILAQYYSDKRDFKEAARSIRQILKKDKTNGRAAFFLARLYYEMPSLVPDSVDRGAYIYSLTKDAAAHNPLRKEQAKLFKILLAISKYPALMQPKEIAQKLYKLINAGWDPNVLSHAQEILYNHTFIDLLLKWADMQSSQEVCFDKKFLESIYCLLGEQYMSRAESQIEADDSGDKSYTIAHKCFESADHMMDGKSFIAQYYLFKLSLQRAFVNESSQLDAAKCHYQKARELSKVDGVDPVRLKYFKAFEEVYFKRLRESLKSPKQ